MKVLTEKQMNAIEEIKAHNNTTPPTITVEFENEEEFKVFKLMCCLNVSTSAGLKQLTSEEKETLKNVLGRIHDTL